MRLVLASGSPRRAALLRQHGYAFEVEAPGVDERVAHGVAPGDAALALARRKALAVAPRGRVVLAADTLLDLDGTLVGKPRDVDDAARILRRLAGRAHDVVTGVAVRTDVAFAADVARTRVTFRPLAADEIARYVATGEPLDKAGAYAIQGGAAAFVESVDGPLDNVVGLPMALVATLLARVAPGVREGS